MLRVITLILILQANMIYAASKARGPDETDTATEKFQRFPRDDRKFLESFERAPDFIKK